MNRGRGLDPSSDLTGSPLEPQAAKLKPNRLSRSFRQSQTAAKISSPKSEPPDFKTPTRVPKSRVTGGFSGESPHEETTHDIIWDATSPSPQRLGKRGRKYRAGVVNISEIVSRIAPKHGRPEVAEPTLQQWIGDSATIPCTPDVQVPKPRKKSPRPNGVDDLLKLAKQFDLNMFRQDEDEVEDVRRHSVELLSGDILDFENDFLPSSHGNHQPAGNAAAGTDVQVHLGQQAEDDLDFLFDGPTQHVSKNLSQFSQIKPPLTLSSKEASGKPPAAGGSTTNTKCRAVNNEFEDDWENDDLLNDSLVLEMTQNPQRFAAPMFCSTQKPVNSPVCGDMRLGQSDVLKAEKENVTKRATFKLELNPNFSARRIQTDTWTNSKVDYSSKTDDKDTQRSRFLYHKGFSVQTGSGHPQQTLNTKSDQQRTCVASSISASPVFNTRPTKTTPKKPGVVSSHVEPAAASDFLDEDLDDLFSSDLVWDDPADDDLLCEMCEDLENQIQSIDNVPTKQTPVIGQTSNHRAVLQPSNRTWDNRNRQAANQQPLPQKQTAIVPSGGSGRPAGRSLAGVSASTGEQVKTASDPFKHTQTKTTSGSTAAPRTPKRTLHKDQFTFKKPNDPVSTNKVLGKCSAAEIELKKQQAMERRRQRLQATQNLRAPT